jgi:hypothetical protein
VILMSLGSVAALAMLAMALCNPPAQSQEPIEQSLHLPKTSAQKSWEQCSIEMKTDSAERSAIETYSSPALEKALLSSKSFWDFITDPSTPYIARLAAADRGGSVLSPEELPVLWQAMAETSSIPSGVEGVSPCSAAGWIPNNSPQPETHEVVLGREVRLPARSVKYPITAEERDRSPWLWQMDKALSTLFDKTNLYYGDPSRYPSRVKAAWAWPVPDHPNDGRDELNKWNNIYLRSRALTQFAPHDTLLIQTILKLALDNDDYYVAYSAPVRDLYTWGNDAYHFEELAHAAQIAVLQKTRWENVASETAFAMESLATQKSDPSFPNLKPLKTVTGILAMARWATDRRLNPSNRYDVFVRSICKIVDDAACPSPDPRELTDAQLNDSLKMFETWFDRKKPDLKKQAEAERPYLASLAKELNIDIE